MLVNNGLIYFSYFNDLEAKCEDYENKPIEFFNIRMKEFNIVGHDQVTKALYDAKRYKI